MPDCERNTVTFASSRIWHRSAWALFMAAGLILSSCGKSSPPASTPKEAAGSFVKAFQDGDMSALHVLCAGNDAEFAMLGHMVEANKAMLRLEAVVNKKFGDQAKSDCQVSSFSETMAKLFETAEFKIDGDNATVVAKEKDSSGDTLKFRKEGGRWKLDIASLGPLAEQEKAYVAMTKFFNATSDKIEAGKYNTAHEVFLDIQQDSMGGP